MDSFTKLINTSTSKEREKIDSKNVNDFLVKAEKISEKSSSSEICDLIAEITNYQLYHTTFFHDILSSLQQLLSECISSKCNCTNCGFVKLHDYINTEKNLLKTLNFIWNKQHTTTLYAKKQKILLLLFLYFIKFLFHNKNPVIFLLIQPLTVNVDLQ